VAFSERLVVPKVSPWRRFAICEGERCFKSPNFGGWFHDPAFAYKREWTDLEESEGVGTCDDRDVFQEQAAAKIVANQGGLVEGRGGTGKPRLIAMLVSQFEASVAMLVG
jgi:hypothetical protein